MSTETLPIVIPPKLKHDRAIRRLLTAWANHHARFHVCEKRVNWKTPASRKIEKSRRREKWICVARILDIEHTLLRWLGSATHHRDLWMSVKRGGLSRRVELRKRYYEQRRLENRLRGAARKEVAHSRELTVGQIRALDRAWMSALFSAVYPNLRCPSPLKLHPTELLPRKIARASKALLAEVTPVTPIATAPSKRTIVVTARRLNSA